MDLYTTSFTYPLPTARNIRNTASPLPPNLPLSGSESLSDGSLPNVTSATTPPRRKPSILVPLTTTAKIEKDWDEVQRMCLAVTTREGCLVTVSREQMGVEIGGSAPLSLGTGESVAPIPDTTLWNFHLSGGYQPVMAARGATLREAPRDNRTVIKVARTDILESPLASFSPLKADVRRFLNQIAVDSLAHIAVVNIEVSGSGVAGGVVIATADGQAGLTLEETQRGEQIASQEARNGSRRNSVNGATGEGTTDTSPIKPREDPQAGSIDSASAPSQANAAANGPVTYGLETERMCELVITGPIESVEIAKVRLLVMLDELVSGPDCF